MTLPTVHSGVGLSLHLDQIDEFLASGANLPYVEVVADNWLSPGPHHKKLEQIRQDYDILFHCVSGNLGGLDPIDLDYWQAIQSLRKRYQPKHVSDHLCFSRDEGTYFHDLLPIPFNEESLKRCEERVLLVQDMISEAILIENLSYYFEYPESTMAEDQFINQLCLTCDSYILLDLNNIWVNEQNLSHSAANYLKNINRDRVREIHLAGPEKIDNRWVDTHGSFVQDSVLEYLETFLANHSVPVIYERDRHRPSFGKLLEECSQINAKIGYYPWTTP
ncbi:DUF692 domain-containing protein [Pseudobacteriovorax antillogorgiicola]|uniref:DUF692 domain-containing protein n=1 Tax=Pseudobacteriovorax antillogorgiicola TaxID=1513793 RepID=A0A1Y6CIW9_9BACT|nr:DUF692 domain-containing protein [Pseudobacteriovorax antillogorgiicola]TCS46988.1 hypothetical protein EDD56_12283 [Pseudobacteriovorax antillogorgiicola]SMF64868.1 hypothetical protein SAMN06296036_12283 [Pseudobacteriovorax antillogorgiicola]